MLALEIFLAIVAAFYLFNGIIRAIAVWQMSGTPQGKEWLMLLLSYFGLGVHINEYAMQC